MDIAGLIMGGLDLETEYGGVQLDYDSNVLAFFFTRCILEGLFPGGMEGRILEASLLFATHNSAGPVRIVRGW